MRNLRHALLGFWDWQQRHEYLAEKKDTLIKLNELVPWSEFRPILEKMHHKERKSRAGRKAIDPIIMFKLLLLQRLSGISDEQLEYQVIEAIACHLFPIQEDELFTLFTYGWRSP